MTDLELVMLGFGVGGIYTMICLVVARLLMEKDNEK